MANGSSNTLTRFFGGSPGWVLLKLILLSIVIGVLMAVLGIDAMSIVRNVERLFRSVFQNAWGAVHALLRWFLLGAVIVFPIWIVLRVTQMGSGKS